MRFTRRQFAGALAAAALPQKPNILYILADDLGCGDLGCYNAASNIPTPHIDRFAREGMRFTDMHSPSSVCTPTRYGILTGRYCWRSTLKRGVLGGTSPYLISRSRLTVPRFLKQQGYRTAGIGKWHLGLQNEPITDYSKPLRPGPLDTGFDTYFGIPASLDMEPYLYFENDRALTQPVSFVKGMREQRGIFWREGRIAPGFRHEDVLPEITGRAVRFLEGQPAARQPFFLYLPLTGPHTPWLPTAKFQGKSKAGPYGDFTHQVDDSVGQVLAALERSGQARQTLVIFTSDNGAHWTPEEIAAHSHRSNGNVRGQKADIYEGGHRIPFLARWPGQVKAGSTSHRLGCLTDLMATAADLCGTRLPQQSGEDSYSLLSAFSGKENGGPRREAVVHHSVQGLFSIRRGKWKLNLGRGSGGFTEPRQITPKPGEPEGELYDLAADPLERHNLYAKHGAVVTELKKLLEQYKLQGRSRPL